MGNYRIQKMRANARLDLLNLNPDVLLDISRPGGVTVDGSNNITNIIDLTGNGVDYYQTADLNRTWTYIFDADVNKYVGVGGVKGGSDNSYYLTSKAYIDTATDTWVFVFKDNPAGNPNATIVGQYGSVGGQLLLLRADNDGLQDIFYARDENNDILQPTTPFLPGWDVIICTREVGKVKMWYNKTIVEETGSYVAGACLPAGVTDFYNPVLGTQPDGLGGLLNAYFSGSFGLMAKFDGVLSDGVINAILNNLIVEWNISNA